MKRRNFLFSIVAFLAIPKLLLARDKTNYDLIIKNGWILKKEDF